MCLAGVLVALGCALALLVVDWGQAGVPVLVLIQSPLYLLFGGWITRRSLHELVAALSDRDDLIAASAAPSRIVDPGRAWLSGLFFGLMMDLVGVVGGGAGVLLLSAYQDLPRVGAAVAATTAALGMLATSLLLLARVRRFERQNSCRIVAVGGYYADGGRGSLIPGRFAAIRRPELNESTPTAGPSGPR